MNIRLVSVIVGILVAGYVGHVQAADDWQYWNGIKLKHALHAQWDAHITLEQRVTGDLSELGLHNYSPGIVYTPNTHVDYLIGYKYELSKGASRWGEEHRLEQMLTLKGSWHGFTGSLGTRFEYRSIDGDERWRWREKAKISRQVKLGNITFTPYISEEFFYDFEVDAYNQNRAVIGVTKRVSSSVTLDLYYMYTASLKSAGWSGVNVIGTGMTIVF
jgi:hypothetical protein